MPTASETHPIIDHIFRLFAERGDDRYGEDVTQRQHALQCAALAERDGQPQHLVAAAFLHDIGHLVHTSEGNEHDAAHDDLHEDLGHNFLKEYFPPEVTEPVRLHVAAKRYLCAVEPAYRAGLSRASEESLMVQGGPMTEAEIAEFESSPHADAAVQLRRYDDTGKDPSIGEVTPERFRPALEASLRTEQGA